MVYCGRILNSLLYTLVERLLGSENGNIRLHDLLHLRSDIGGASWTISSADLVYNGDGLVT